MRERLRSASKIILGLLALVAIVFLYARFGITAFHHDRIEAALSDAVGLDVSADEPIDLQFGRNLVVTATNLALQREDSEPLMLVERLDVTVNARSLLQGPTDVRLINIDGADINLQQNEEAESVDERLFSDAPIDLAALEKVDLSAKIVAARTRINGRSLGSIRADLAIDGGGVSIEQFEVREGDASLAGSLSLQRGEGALEFAVDADLANWRSAMLAIDGEEYDAIPPFSGSLRLTGSGSSLHAFAAGANGRLSGRHAAGSVDLRAAGALFADIAASLVNSLNPLAESRPHATLECGIYEIDVVDGVAQVEQLSVQTDRLTIISSGDVNLDTEEIDLALRTRSRQGLGLNIGNVATSFVKVGGSLSEPNVDIDAGGAVTTTGAAVATGGLSVIAKGLWDRLSGETDLCEAE